MQKNWKMIGTLAHVYSPESAQRELSNEYQHDRVFKNLCMLKLLWTNVASAMEGIIQHWNMVFLSTLLLGSWSILGQASIYTES